MSITESWPLGFTPSPKVAAEIQSFALNYLRDVTPVRTGNLRAGWDVQVNGSTVDVSNPVHYARFVNNGTRKMRARNMTDTAHQALEPFAARRSELEQLLEAEPNLQFVGTGDAELDRAILDAARQLTGQVRVDRKQTGVFNAGLRTLATFNTNARQNQYQRQAELADLYGQVAEVLGIGPTLELR